MPVIKRKIYNDFMQDIRLDKLITDEMHNLEDILVFHKHIQ